MKNIYIFIALGLVVCLGLTPSLRAETTSASATATSASSSTPSTYSIKQHFLSMQIARIKSEMQQATRCIANAANTQTNRDSEGNTTREATIDANNCARRLAELTRQLEALTRKATAVTQDATAAGYRAEWVSRESSRIKRTQAINSASDN